MIFMLLSSIPSLSLMISLVVKQSNVNILFLEFWFIFKNVFPLYIFHFMCISHDHFVSHQGIFILATLTAIPLCWKNWNVDYICRSFWKLNFPAKPKSKPKPQLNQNNHYPGLLSYTRHPPTPSKMISLPNIKILLWISFIRKNDQISWLIFHSAYFS